MKAIRLRNIRSLSDTGMLEIKPITLFLGQNSSGKSTVLRALPMLKQSELTRSKAPILWYGDYVDFGSVREVKSRFSPEGRVSIDLDFGFCNIIQRSFPSATRILVDLCISLQLVEIDDQTRLTSFTVISGTDRLIVTFDLRGVIASVIVNGNDLSSLLPPDRYRFNVSEVVPQMEIKSSSDTVRSPYYERFDLRVEGSDIEIRKIITRGLHKGVKEQTIVELANRIEYKSGPSFLDSLRSLSTPLESWHAFTSGLGFQEPTLERLRALTMLSWLPDIMLTLQRKVSRFAKNLSYVGPTRATGERYYRIQELAVDEIDPQGKNVAMFLHALSSGQIKLFSTWLEQAIGYGIRVEKSGGHIQIKLHDQNADEYYNIADMGYGLSQILPILAQVWSRQNRRPLSVIRDTIVAMEQPELHLHPAYQAKIADVLANSVSQRYDDKRISFYRGLRFVVETHSEAIVNRLGALVELKRLNREDVIIYIFEKRPDDQVTRIREAKFDDVGILNNWPIGFFSTEMP